MVTTGALNIDLSMNNAKFAADIAKAQQQADSFATKTNTALGRVSAGFNSMNSSIKNTISQMFSLNGLGVTLGGATFGLLEKSAIDYATSLVNTADKLGITTKQLQEYEFGAKEAGVSTETFINSFEKFNKTLAQAQVNNPKAVQTFKDLDISLKNADGTFKSSSQAFDEAGAKLGSMASKAQETRLATELMGKGAAEMLNIFKGGAAGIEEFKNQAEQLGVVLDDQLLRNSKAAGLQLEQLGEVLKVKLYGSLLTLTPELGKMANELINDLPAIISFADGILKAANYAAQLYENVVKFGAGQFFDGADLVTIDDYNKKIEQLNKDIETYQSLKMDNTNDPFVQKNIDSDIAKVKELTEARDQLAQSGSNNNKPANDNAANDQSTARAQAQAEQDEIDRMAQLHASTEKLTQLKSQANELTKKMLTPEEQYNKAITDGTTMLQAGLITQETYNRSVERAQVNLIKSTSGFIALRTSLDAIEQGLQSGVSGWQAWGKIAIGTILKVIDEVLALKAAQASGGSGGGGTAGGLLSIINLGMSLYNGTGSADLAPGDAGFIPPVKPAVAHTGGTMGSSSLSRRSIGAGAFAGARRYHTGGNVLGLKSGEVPAILEEGESVVSKQDKKNSGRNIGNVYNIDARGADHAAVEQLKQVVSQLNSGFEKRAVSAIRTERIRNPRIMQ